MNNEDNQNNDNKENDENVDQKKVELRKMPSAEEIEAEIKSKLDKTGFEE